MPERWSRGCHEHVGSRLGVRLGHQAFATNLGYFWMPHPRPLVLHFGIPSRFGGGIYLLNLHVRTVRYDVASRLQAASGGPGIFCEGARKNAGFMAKHWYQTGGVSWPMIPLATRYPCFTAPCSGPNNYPDIKWPSWVIDAFFDASFRGGLAGDHVSPSM